MHQAGAISVCLLYVLELIYLDSEPWTIIIDTIKTEQ